MITFICQVARTRGSIYSQTRNKSYDFNSLGFNGNYDDGIDNQLTNKALCTYKKLVETYNNYKKAIGKFIDDPKYKLILKEGNCASSDNACTMAEKINDTGEITLIIEDTTQNGLGIVSSILHEGLHAEMHRFVSRYEPGVEPNNRPRLFKLYAFYKGWTENTQDADYNWKNDAIQHYMVENYVEVIAKDLREIDNNRYPLSHYLAYGWDGLTKYGYTAKQLTEAQDTQNQNLRSVVQLNNLICN